MVTIIYDLESQLIQHLFRTSTFTKPTTIAIALCSVAPTDSTTGALTNNELANLGAYARQTLNANDTSWANIAVSTGSTSNTPAITFPVAGADWGTITNVAITDNATIGAGNLWFYGSLTVNKVVSNGDQFQFAANQLAVQIDN